MLYLHMVPQKSDAGFFDNLIFYPTLRLKNMEQPKKQKLRKMLHHFLEKSIKSNFNKIKPHLIDDLQLHVHAPQRHPEGVPKVPSFFVSIARNSGFCPSKSGNLNLGALHIVLLGFHIGFIVIFRAKRQSKICQEL